jgi:hypothetical protein
MYLFIFYLYSRVLCSLNACLFKDFLLEDTLINKSLSFFFFLLLLVLVVVVVVVVVATAVVVVVAAGVVVIVVVT